MENASSNQIPKRSYLPKKTRQVQFIPPAEAMKLVSGTRARCCRSLAKKPSMLEARGWKTRCFRPSHARSAPSSTLVSHTKANSQSIGANQIGKAHQEVIQTPKSAGICSEGSKSCFPKPNPKTSLKRVGLSIDPDKKAGLGVSKEKSMEKFTIEDSIGPAKAPVAAHERKLACEDGPKPKSAKLAHAARDVSNP